jgi:hypothetical protein
MDHQTIDPRLIAPAAYLPAGFVYQPEYLAYLPFDEAEVEKNDDCYTTLGFTWPNGLGHPYYRIFDNISIATDSFSQGIMELFGVRRKRRLVPFASENDRHWCFINDGTQRIFMVDLGVSPLMAHPTGHRNFAEFISDVRRQYEQEPWKSS